MKIVKTINLRKYYGDVKALKNINLDIEENEWVSIVGPSGSGKTTLLNILGGIDRLTGGEVFISDINLNNLNENELAKLRREKIGFIFQQHHLISYLTAVENVMLAQYFHSITDEEEAKEALIKVGLKDRTYHKPGQLSGGEQQRVCIARALINQPMILFADEPTGDLDKKNTLSICDLIKELYLKEKFTVIIVTHNQEVANYAQRVITLDSGEIIKDEKRI